MTIPICYEKEVRVRGQVPPSPCSHFFGTAVQLQRTANTPCLDFPGVNRMLSCQIQNKLLFPICHVYKELWALIFSLSFLHHSSTKAISPSAVCCCEFDWCNRFTQSQVFWKTIWKNRLTCFSLTIAETTANDEPSNKKYLRLELANSVINHAGGTDFFTKVVKFIYQGAFEEEFCFIPPATVFYSAKQGST